MKKDDIWVFSLGILLFIALATHWTFWIRLAVMLNALLVLFNIGKGIYKNHREGKTTNGSKK